MTTQEETIAALGNYEFGWSDPDTAGAVARRGLNEDVVRCAAVVWCAMSSR